MNAKAFRKFLDRDGGCVHCGDVETAVPHHRANRGMGGSKLRDVPSNIVSMCALINGLMESDAYTAELSRTYGWKVSTATDASLVPVWYPNLGRWFFLDDDFGLHEVGEVA